MATLKENPTLNDYQLYIKQICLDRGWNKNNHLEIFLLFMEEVGELAKAIRNRDGLYVEKAKQTNQFELEEEFADVFNYFIDLANCFQIDLEKAIRTKEAINAQRIWNNNK